MYTKPAYYKIYSMMTFIISIASVVVSIVMSLFFSSQLDSLLNLLPLGNDGFLVKTLFFVVDYLLIIISAISVFFCYMDFSSMFQFADMIHHEQSGSINPLVKRKFVMPAKAYRNFGTVIFTIDLIAVFIVAIALIITTSVKKQAFIALPVIPLAIMFLYLLLQYIMYFVRFKAFGDLLEIATTKDVTQQMKENLKANKTGILRSYCGFLAVITALMIIGEIVLMIIMFDNMVDSFGLSLTLFSIFGYIALTALQVICFAITGCYYDNLAKMVEHNLIKFKLI